MKYCLLLSILLIASSNALAETNVSDANNPTMERYCDPAQNADIYSQIKKYEDQIAALPKNDPKISVPMTEISKLSLKIKCSYRKKSN